jgi:catechol-2,3-dioxygenase
MKIRELKIYTKSLLEQIDFYANQIGLDIETSETEAQFTVGKSILKIVLNHIAINIPSNREKRSLRMVKRTSKNS